MANQAIDNRPRDAAERLPGEEAIRLYIEAAQAGRRRMLPIRQ